MLALFGNTLTDDHMNSLHNRVKFPQQVQTSLSQNPKVFSRFFCHFWNLHEIFCILKKNISFIAQIFLRLLFPKNVVTRMPKSFRFITPFRNQRVHGSHTLVNSLWPLFYHYFPLIQEKIQLENISLSQIWDLRTLW